MAEMRSLSVAKCAATGRADDGVGAGERPGMSEFSRLRGAFRDHALENAYRKHLETSALPHERRIWLVMSFAYFIYSVLDVLTIPAHLVPAILTVRCLVLTPIALSMLALTYVERMKPYIGAMFAFGVFLSGISIVWMISVMPAQGSPPYIIGVMIVFIFAASNVRMPFPAATGAFTLTALAYSFILLNDPKFTRTDIIAGHFFMVSSAGAAILTNLVQEIRLRMIWINNERRRSDAERIEELMIEATASDQSKINFLSILSHELRTPLHQIIGFSEVLRSSGDHADSAKASEYLGEIHSSAHRLLASIAKMLRYADATAGKISYNYDRYQVSEIVEFAMEQFASRAAQREISIEADAVADALITIDQASASYAIGCLIDNAINASPAHSRITIAGAPVAGGRYELKISDRGVGMTPDQIRRAFEPFQQTGEARTRASEGVGLGLTLARKILTDQGAELTLHSTPGAGVVARILFAAGEQAQAA